MVSVLQIMTFEGWGEMSDTLETGFDTFAEKLLVKAFFVATEYGCSFAHSLLCSYGLFMHRRSTVDCGIHCPANPSVQLAGSLTNETH